MFYVLQYEPYLPIQLYRLVPKGSSHAGSSTAAVGIACPKDEKQVHVCTGQIDQICVYGLVLRLPQSFQHTTFSCYVALLFAR